ncbi:hypothetical protein G6F42_028327 [Rhizopus arrhizus]|nr:hypothetical protein G6F42_028327 [Rhizopus arrhizus]
MERLPTDSILFDDVAGVSSENITQYKDAFYGYQCFEWISEYTSVVSSEESEMIAAEFVQEGRRWRQTDSSTAPRPIMAATTLLHPPDREHRAQQPPPPTQQPAVVAAAAASKQTIQRHHNHH